MKQKKYYMIVNKNGNPMLINGQLPIYYLKKVALLEAAEFNCEVVTVTIQKQ